MPATTPAARDGNRVTGLVPVLVWLAVVVAGFWWFALKDLRPFQPADSAALFSADDLPGIHRFVDQHRTRTGPGAARLTVLHLRDARCACNRFTDPHVAALRSEYAARRVRVATLAIDTGDAATRAWLPATPAALVLDADRRVLYLGPLSNSANCGREAAPVERVLDAALAGMRDAVTPTLGTGCFCT